MKSYSYGRRLIPERQMYRRWIDQRLPALRRSDVIAYLRARGWTEVPPDRDGFLVFREPSSDDGPSAACYQFVPASEGHDSYIQEMFELVTGVAEFEDRQASEVIDDILRQAGRDGVNGAAAQTVRAGEAK